MSDYKSIRETAIDYIKAGEVMPMDAASVLKLITDLAAAQTALQDKRIQADIDFKKIRDLGESETTLQRWLKDAQTALEAEKVAREGLKCCGNCSNWMWAYGFKCRNDADSPSKICIRHPKYYCGEWRG